MNRTLLTRRHVICERVGPATALRRSAVLSDTRTRGSRLSKLVTTALTHHQRAYHDYTKHYRSGNPLSRFIGPQVGRFHPIAAVVVGMVGLASKLFLAIFTRTAVLHADRLRRHVYGRSRVEAGAGKGVVTVLNHTSTMDDPVLWGVLPLWVLLSHRRNRWALAAQDICYTNPVAQV